MSSAEALQYYLAALKQGQREYKNCVHRGLAPNIQALGPDKLQLSQVNLGVMDVPIYLVVGSTEEARCNSFSAGFFPPDGAGVGICHEMGQPVRRPAQRGHTRPHQVL